MSKPTLRELLLGGPGLNGYADQADVYCVERGRSIVRQLWDDGKLPPTMDECSDTERCPCPIFYGESPDCEQHCAECGEYLYGESQEEEEEGDQ